GRRGWPARRGARTCGCSSPARRSAGRWRRARSCPEGCRPGRERAWRSCWRTPARSGTGRLARPAPDGSAAHARAAADRERLLARGRARTRSPAPARRSARRMTPRPRSEGSPAFARRRVDHRRRELVERAFAEVVVVAVDLARPLGGDDDAGVVRVDVLEQAVDARRDHGLATFPGWLSSVVG